jgi:hypothetical protein
MSPNFPADFDPHTVCLSVDVEWASRAVIDDLRAVLDERGLRATFFATHPGIEVGGHERGIHPNFRRDGDVARALAADREDDGAFGEAAAYERVVARFKSFAPEARGVRAHSLHYDSLLLPIYARHAIEYDSSYQIPLVPGLRPFWKEHGLVEIPVYFNDYFELNTGALSFDGSRMDFSAPGLKVILLHPNLVYLNAESEQHYFSIKKHYHDPERLLAARGRKRGVRTMALELLDRLAGNGCPTATLGEVNALWRAQPLWT